jgi:hypothetical protein
MNRDAPPDIANLGCKRSAYFARRAGFGSGTAEFRGISAKILR